mmetsp:Transcript_32264/g.96757  ORF Transcript_32264/g.96757 Transcript_32264/m.96757 type:complete len:490 (-) Transcript_32264:717-2186(-)
MNLSRSRTLIFAVSALVAVVLQTPASADEVNEARQPTESCEKEHGGETCDASAVQEHGQPEESENTAENQKTLEGFVNDKDDVIDEGEEPFIGRDLHEDCPTLARDVDDETGLSRCEYERPSMLSECAESCLSITGISARSLGEEELVVDAMAGYGYLIVEENGDSNEEKCEDDHEECEGWAEEAECMDNPDFMVEQCKKSCRVCFEPGVHAFAIGVEQRVDFYDSDDIREHTIDNIRKTLHYMVDEVMVNEKFLVVRRDCFNHDAKCSYWAAQGDCDGSDEEWMAKHCSPACQSCLSVEYRHRCEVDPDNPLHKDAIKKGGLNTMFDQIMEAEVNARYDPVAFSRPYHPGEKGDKKAEEPREGTEYILGPWVVLLSNFLSEEEAEHLIALGHKMEFDISMEVSDTEKNEDGTYRDDIPTEGRTSTNAWCSDECHDDPIATRIRKRIEDLTGIPEDYSEDLQLLKYEPGQFYEGKFSWISHFLLQSAFS